MIQPSPEMHAMARRLLDHEAGGSRSSSELAEAAERACQKLYQQLERLVGPAGFNAFLARALHLAKAEFPFLEGIKVEVAANGCLSGLRQKAQDEDPAEVSRGLASVLGNFISMLITFIGEDLALRQVGNAWPDLPFD